MSWMGWLQCKIHRGMFPDEVGVIVERIDGGYLTFFLPKTFVRASGGDDLTSSEIAAEIQVQVFDEDDTVRVVQLPRVPFEGSRYARVPRRFVATT